MPASRPYRKGYLKLSFVSCPIALYPAISAAERISFRQVNRRTGHRLKHRLIDSVTGQTVDATDKAPGYEVGEKEFLLVEDRDLERARRMRSAPGEEELTAPRHRKSPPTAPAALATRPTKAPATMRMKTGNRRKLSFARGRRIRARSRSNASFPQGRSMRNILRSRTTSCRGRRSVKNRLR